VGLTWIALVTPERERVKHFLWSGDREANQHSSAEAALQMLLEELDQ
jgi:nicotinamide mononucleotide (NMN) deamidase PncC